MIRQPQCAHVGARTWIAHSKLSKTWLLPLWTIVNALSYSLPHNTHFAMAGLLENRTSRASSSPVVYGTRTVARVQPTAVCTGVERTSWCRERESNPHSVASSRFWLRPRFALNVRRAPHVSLHQIRFEPTNLHRGAGRGKRTLTLLPELDFESSASTNSAIPADSSEGDLSPDVARARWSRHYRENGRRHQLAAQPDLR